MAARAAPAGRSSESLGVVAVRIGSQEFLLDIMSVREIRGWVAPTPLPRAPAYVPGMIDLRGVVIPIIDLGARLGLKATEASATSVVIVTQIRDRLAGLLVDGVSDLMEVEVARVQATPETGSAEPNAVIRGVVEIDGRILGLIALDTVIPADLPDPAVLDS
jgi:purine-binding chemotaxis protein CheW